MIFLISFLMYCGSALAGVVTGYRDHEQIDIYVEEGEKPYEYGDLILFRGSNGIVIGYGSVSRPQGDSQYAIVKLWFHEYQKMVIPGDATEHPDYSGRSPLLEGRHDLMIRGKGKPAYFKRLPYFGSAMSFGHVLDAGEVLFDLGGSLQLGLSDEVTISTQAIYALLGVISGEVRVETWNNEAFTLTSGLGLAYQPKDSEQVVLIRNLLSFKSYSKLRSYTLITVALKPGGGIGNAIEQSEISGGYEYVMSDWNRILIGPSYNIEQKAVGAFASYVWIWDRFYALAGFKSQNLFRFKIATDAYVPNLSLMYRF